MKSISMSNLELHAALLARGDDVVGLPRCPAERFLTINSASPRLGGRDCHVPMLVHVPRCDNNEVGFRLQEHFAVVGKGVRQPEKLSCLLTSFGMTCSWQRPQWAR